MASLSTQGAEVFNRKVANLARLCKRFTLAQDAFPGPLCLFDILGRILLWAGKEDGAIIAFERQITKHDTEPNHGNARCDGCEKELNFTTKRFVCKACKDVDLCYICHEDYKIDGLLVTSARERCQAHLFLAVPGADWSLLEPGSVSRDGMSVSSWLEQLSSISPQL
jgi:hypothetical protein